MNQKDQPGRLMAESYPLSFVNRLIYRDMDAFRHLNNGATGQYFEEGRSDLNSRIFGADCMIDPKDGLQLLGARILIDYLLQAHYPGNIEIGTAIGRIGNSSYVIVQGAFQSGRCVALSEGVMVKAYDGKPAPITPEERAAMEGFALRA